MYERYYLKCFKKQSKDVSTNNDDAELLIINNYWYLYSWLSDFIF